MFAGHIALQLVDLRMEHQANRFMGCDYNIELFFRWVKCVLGCRHLLSQGINGGAPPGVCSLYCEPVDQPVGRTSTDQADV